ncbi:MAG: sulfotransferase family protein [Phenylobacterium sp.]
MTLKVIGSGFGRTGTMSLKLALEQIGLGPCYHMVEVFKNPAAFDWWSEAADDPSHANWARIFAGYSATVDWPNATYYKELAAAYPDAKVVHTERDEDEWFASTQATIFMDRGPPDPNNPMMRMMGKVIYQLFDGQKNDKDKVIAAYRKHNAEVREVIAADRLLVYHVSDGWGPLCEFLGAPLPEGGTPKVNSREEFAAMIANMAAGGPPGH